LQLQLFYLNMYSILVGLRGKILLHWNFIFLMYIKTRYEFRMDNKHTLVEMVYRLPPLECTALNLSSLCRSSGLLSVPLPRPPVQNRLNCFSECLHCCLPPPPSLIWWLSTVVSIYRRLASRKKLQQITVAHNSSSFLHWVDMTMHLKGEAATDKSSA